MRAFDTVELSRLRSEQVSSLQDTGVHLIRWIALGANNEQVETFDDGEEYACGFEPVDQSEQVFDASPAGEVLGVIRAARLRLPLSAVGVVTDGDRWRLTERFGSVLAEPLIFQIVGEPRPGITGVELDLREVSP
jgi:hypothetical protein